LARNDLESELKFHEREWRVQRFGWIGLCGFILAALLGVFGNGPLSERVAGDPRIASVKYERFVRYGSQTLIELTMRKSQQHDPAVEIDAQYFRKFEITSIVPAPRSTEILGERYRLNFAADAVPGTISIRVTPQSFGRAHARVSIADSSIELRQFIYP